MDFPPMLSNSALMQSYNLMKMSSEVTKTQNTPQFANPEVNNDYYSKAQIDFNNRNRMPPQRSPPPPPQFEKHASDNFLCKQNMIF